MSRLARLALLAYPRAFRREYGDEILRTFRDQRRHGSAHSVGMAGRFALDVAFTASRMRLESMMSHGALITLAIVLGLAVLAAVVGSPAIVLFVLAIVAAAAILVLRHDRPIVADREQAAGGYRWLVAGAGSFGVGFAALATNNGGELSSFAWKIWFFSWALGFVLVLFGMALGVAHLFTRRTT